MCKPNWNLIVFMVRPTHCWKNTTSQMNHSLICCFVTVELRKYSGNYQPDWGKSRGEEKRKSTSFGETSLPAQRLLQRCYSSFHCHATLMNRLSRADWTFRLLQIAGVIISFSLLWSIQRELNWTVDDWYRLNKLIRRVADRWRFYFIQQS